MSAICASWPAPKPKTIHRAAKVAEDGSVSALCFKNPRAIDLSKATWTLVDRVVTCKRCKMVIAKRGSKS